MTKNEPKPKRRTQRKQEVETLDLLPRDEVLRKADDLLRTLLNSPPAPRAKPKKRAK